MRDEAANVHGWLESIARQPETGAIVACDDGSCDETQSYLREAAARDARVGVLAMPDGAGGSKAAALARAARCPPAQDYRYLLFTDADVRLETGAVAALLAQLRRSGAHALTAWPRVAPAGAGDRLFAPLLTLTLLQWLPMWRAGDPRCTAGNGQLFLVEAEAYRRCGGHAVIDDVVEDVALARNLTRCGYTVAFASAADVARVAGYGSPRAAVAGLGRSLYAGGGIPACGLFACWQIVAFVLPYALLAVVPLPAAIAIAAGLAARLSLAARMRHTPASVALTPISAALAAIAAVAIALAGACGALTWRGRTVRR